VVKKVEYCEIKKRGGGGGQKICYLKWKGEEGHRNVPNSKNRISEDEDYVKNVQSGRKKKTWRTHCHKGKGEVWRCFGWMQKGDLNQLSR